MITTLDQLHEHVSAERPLWKRRKRMREARVFVILFVAIYSIHTVAVNFEVIAMSIAPEDNQTVLTEVYSEEDALPELNNKQIHHAANQSPEEIQKNQAQINELQQQLGQYKPLASSDFEASQKLESSLRQKLNDYSIKFNILPPSNRLIIPKISVDAPIQEVKTEKPVNEISKDDYDKELYNGVVKYPTTASPSSKPLNGQTMIFGHTSYESWKKNEYGSVFAKLPALQDGDTIQSVWNGTLYTYKVVEKRIISPSQLDAMYNEFSDGNFISLVGCYPIGTTRERIVIVAELLQEEVFAEYN